MQNPASASDLWPVWPFPTEVPTIAQAKLDQAWRALQSEVAGIPERVAAGTLDEQVVIDVLLDATIRVLRNPDGYTKGSIQVDDAQKSWELADRGASSDLYFTAAEKRRVSSVGARGSAFTIRPGAPRCW